MHSKIEVEFQGQIKTVLKESIADLDTKVKKIFHKLRIQSHLTATGIRKNDGYNAIELVYAMVNMCFMHIHGIADFVKRNLTVICEARKDAFYKGYQEPEIDKLPGAKLSPKFSWAAFFSTDTTLAPSEVVKKFMSRWSIEVFFKEAKTTLGLGKDPSQSFAAQICAITLTFLRYNLLAFLKEQQTARSSTGELFHQLEQEIAPLNYMKKIVDYFRQFMLACLNLMHCFGYLAIGFENLSVSFINSINEIHFCQGCET